MPSRKDTATRTTTTGPQGPGPSATPGPDAASAFVAGLEQVSGHLPEAMLAITRMQGTLFDAAMRQNIELLEFLKNRFERDRALAAAIARAPDPSQAVAMWSEFLQQAAADYADEPRRLATVMTEAMGTALDRARRDAEALMDATKATNV